MADLGDFEIQNTLDGIPDLSDLVLVIVNVETRDGRQFSIPLYPAEEKTMRAEYREQEHGREEIHAGDRVEPVGIIFGRTVHTFVVTVEDAS